MSDRTEPPNLKLWEIAGLALPTLLLSLSLGIVVISLDRQNAERAFNQRADTIHESLAERAASTEAVLTALTMLRHKSGELGTEEFATLADELLAAYSHIEAIALVDPVSAAQRPGYEAGSPSEGRPGTPITERSAEGTPVPAARRALHLPIRTVAPMSDQFTSLLGYDLLSDPGLAAALERAIETGKVAAAVPSDILHGDQGYIAFKAVYRGRDLPQSPEARLQRLDGLIVIHLCAKTLLAEVVEQNRDLGVAFGLTPQRPLYRRSAESETLPTFGLATLTWSRTLPIGGQVFTLELERPVGLGSLRIYLILLVMLLPWPAAIALALAIRSTRRGLRQAGEGARKLRMNEKRFRDYAEVASDWFWSADSSLRFDYFSLPATAGTGLTIGDSLVERLGFDSGGNPEAEALLLRDTLNGRLPFRDLRYRHEQPGAPPRWWSLSGKPVFDEQGNFCCYRGTGRDITSEILAAEALLSAKEAAEIANRSKSQFLASISHELRTPLNAIIGFSELMQKEVLGPLGRDEYRDYAGDIRESGRHLLDLINDILDLSKIESGTATLIEDIIEVPQIVGSAITMVKGRAHQGEVELVVELPADPPLLKGDSRKIKQILVNLLANGIKFTPQGGRVSLGFELAGDGTAVLGIVDTGIGMAPEDIPKALIPFQQIDSDLDRKFEGTGLGLPLCKALCEMHGGKLEIESAPGVGTTVRVRLPAERVCQVGSGAGLGYDQGFSVG